MPSPEKSKVSKAENYYNAAWKQLKTNNIDAAVTLLNQSIETHPSPAAYHTLGDIASAEGSSAQAINYYSHATNLDPGFHQSYAALAEVLRKANNVLGALDAYGQGIEVAPKNAQYKETFLKLAQSLKLNFFNDRFRNTLTLCLQSEGADFIDAGNLWLGALKKDPQFKPALKLLKQKKYTGFKKTFEKILDHKILLSPYFLAGLENLRIADPEFERFLTFLRRTLLDLSSYASELSKLVKALSRYCYFTEYIFETTPEEEQSILDLKNLIEGNNQASSLTITMFSCYQPLYSLINANEVLKAHLSLEIADIVNLQIGEFNSLQEIKKKIKSITEISEGVSNLVRQQYEQSPYPRWNSYSTTIHSEEHEGFLKGKKANILVAGCGTGREAIELASVFPDAQILAVDLSLSSLAYATQKAEKFGLKNITFRQADISNLDQIPNRFDFIACSGVLHHMKEVFSGWKVLAGLLKPAGVMRVALYSALAREPINEARSIIAQKGFAADQNGMREFRKHAKKLLKKKSFNQIARSKDYYALSECRDLLFHTQENQCNLVEIDNYLQELALKFLGFNASSQLVFHYKMMFPQDYTATDLKSWAQYEEICPGTFAAMYRFWCGK